MERNSRLETQGNGQVNSENDSFFYMNGYDLWRIQHIIRFMECMFDRSTDVGDDDIPFTYGAVCGARDILHFASEKLEIFCTKYGEMEEDLSFLQASQEKSSGEKDAAWKEIEALFGDDTIDYKWLKDHIIKMSMIYKNDSSDIKAILGYTDTQYATMSIEKATL